MLSSPSDPPAVVPPRHPGLASGPRAAEHPARYAEHRSTRRHTNKTNSEEAGPRGGATPAALRPGTRGACHRIAAGISFSFRSSRRTHRPRGNQQIPRGEALLDVQSWLLSPAAGRTPSPATLEGTRSGSICTAVSPTRRPSPAPCGAVGLLDPGRAFIRARSNTARAR